jgi:hypothetical protein
MYIRPTMSGTDRSGQHVSRRGDFLLLIQEKDKCAKGNVFAIVRKVALQQLGHFMMGSVNICGKWQTVSGTYGNDGLPMDVEKLPSDAVRLPDELFDAWNKGGGWNSAGSESDAMSEWAREKFKRNAKDRVWKVK